MVVGCWMYLEGVKVICRLFLMFVGSVVVLLVCGFQLCGQQDYVFKYLFVVGVLVFVEVWFMCFVQVGSDMKIVKLVDDVDVVLCMWELCGQNMLMFNKYGFVQEYVLFYMLNYMLMSKDGIVLILLSVIVLNCVMMYSDQYMNVKVQEVDILYGDMQNDVVDQLMWCFVIVYLLMLVLEDVVLGVVLCVLLLLLLF